MDPFILITFDNSSTETAPDGIVSLAMFEWYDQGLLGVYSTPEAEEVRELWENETCCGEELTLFGK